MKRFFLIHIFLSCMAHLHAQQKEYIYKNFTQEEGLPSNEIYCAFEDSKHYLWIGTDNGVVRYNGNKFQQYNLPDNVIFQIREDSKGRVWFFSHTGKLSYFENEKVFPFKYNKILAKHIKNLHIKDAYVDSSGTISINSAIDSSYVINASGAVKGFGNSNTPSQSFFKIDVKENRRCFTQVIKNCVGSSDTIFVSVSNRNKNTQYTIPINHNSSSYYGSICTENGDIYFFYGRILIEFLKNGEYKIRQMPYQLLCLKFYDNTLWAGMLKGGVQLFTEGLLPTKQKILLAGSSVSCIESDYENGLWLSTIERGLYYIKNKQIKQVVFNDSQPIKVSRVYNYKDSILLYANTKGIYKWQDEKSSPVFPLDNTNISGILVSKNKTLICTGGFDFFVKSFRGTGNGFKNFACFNGQTKETVLIGDSFLCSSSTLYVWAEVSDFFRSSSPPFPYFNSVTARKRLSYKSVTLFADSKNNLWGGGNDGLYISHPPYDTMTKVETTDILISKGITHIAQFANGILCAGLRFGGVVLLNDSNVIVNISEKNGLLSDKVNYLLPVKNQLWAATIKGVSVIKFTSFKPVQYSIINIDKNDGFYNLIISQLTQYKNNIVAATNNGMYIFENPDSIIAHGQYSIPFYVNSINSYLGDTSNIDNITLPYSKNRLVIKYDAISFNSYENITYLYRFDHGDTVWHSTTNNELILENTQPGTYILSIKAVIETQNRQSQIKQFTFIIQKPWWQNNWLRLLTVLAISFSVYLVVRRRVKKIKAEEKRKTDLNAKLTELEQTALRSQMNPHFIFNCLTSIQQLIISGNKVDANEYLVKFSRLIRKTLDMSARPFISIAEETKYLEEYLFLEQLRLSGRFDFSITADDSINTNTTFIPNMMIQPVVENCVRHGIKSLNKTMGIITVNFKANKNSITCTITDNGVGRNSISTQNKNTFTEHKSYGMNILRRRLETFSEFRVDESGMEINDLYDNNGLPSGTEVILHLPYKNNV